MVQEEQETARLVELWYRTPPAATQSGWKGPPHALLKEWMDDVTLKGKKWVKLHMFEIREGKLLYTSVSEPGNKWVLEPYTAIGTLARLINTEEFK